MTSKLIDVWNIKTFDDALMTELDAKREALCNYARAEEKNFREQQAARAFPMNSGSPEML